MKKLLTFAFLCLLANSAFSQKIDTKLLEGIKIRSIGPAGMSGRVTSIDVDLVNNIIYVGTASGGVWKSVSGGVTWEPIFDKEALQSIGSVKVNPSNPMEIWVGTGEGNPRNSMNSGEGIYKSIDGGLNWTLMGLEKTRLIHRIIIHKDQPNTILVAALGSAWGPNKERGVYKSTDGGKNWKQVLYNNDETGVADMVVDPRNPNKLFAAMWEFGRKPWTFNSGGEGSGLYVTYDAGDNWKKLTDKEGLPKGQLGRIGLAIAPSKPDVVYAYVEAKKNELFRSEDGGNKWKKVGDKNIGNRPFYYADIFVDPKNENRVYSIHSVITRSEDGGKTFETIVPYRGVHPDHHAFWIHPDNPNYIIEGNDGGLNISHDGAKTWRFVENLPLAQFYHINYDMDFPYNIYGGMQDNGSWVGPSSVLKRGGIRNNDWQELYFGDGFDVVPRPSDNRYGYAMSQGGNVGYYDRETGNTVAIKPVHPDGLPLRFNWNAAIAQNPFEDCGIYFGSQYVHKTLDCGTSWEIISPDLTTNDTTKQKQDESGGLTIDATQAENFTTILAIAPSPVDKDIIWVGTDDGNLQLTKDGGKNWSSVGKNLPGCPSGSWIPQIEVSKKNKGEAFVVVNNYRRNDFTPYAYHTKDFGVTWKRIIDQNKVKGHALCIVQDPEEEKLLFLGTDYGLYLSIDGGSNWNKWMNDYPSVSTIDLKIHPREHDLIVGTFGRAAWVLDDIRPLRTLAQTNGKTLKEEFKTFPAPDAYLTSFRSYDGVRFTADATFMGDNKGRGARITAWVKKEDEKDKKEITPTVPAVKSKKKKKGADKEEESTDGKDKKKGKKKGEKVKVMVIDMQGDTIRTFTQKLKPGMNRFSWNMRQDGISYPSWSDPKPDADKPSGPSALPGDYKLLMDYNGHLDSTMVTVKTDPRENISIQTLQKRDKALKDYFGFVEKCTDGFNRLKDFKKSIKLVNEQMVHAPDTVKKDFKKDGKALTQKIDSIMTLYTMPRDLKGIHGATPTLNRHLWRAASYLYDADGDPGQNALSAVSKAKKEARSVFEALNEFYQGDWTDYQEKVKAVQVKLFKEYEPIEMEE